MANLSDPAVQALFEQPHHAVLSTFDPDGTIHSAVVWADLEDGAVAVNSSVGRRWPSNLERDPRATLVVYDQANPYEYVAVSGRAEMTREGADAHIDRLAKKYMGADEYPFRQPGEERVKFLVRPDRVRHVKQ